MKIPPAEALARVENTDTPTITPELAAAVLGCDPQKIRVQALYKPELLGFPVIRMGSRTRIPRVPFLAYIGVKGGGQS